MNREPAEPLVLATQAQKDVYADWLERMAERANGSTGQHIRNAASLARGDNFYAQT